MIADHAEKIICLHLPRRKDRALIARRTFESENILQHVMFYAGVDGQLIRPPSGWRASRGAYGCLISHLAVIETARMNKWKSVMVFEDDIVLVPDFVELLDRCVARLDDKWDALYMRSTCSLKGAKFTSGHFSFRTTGALGRLGCIYNDCMYDALIEASYNAQTGAPWSRGDVAYASIHKHFRVFAARPFLIGQIPTHSETEGRQSLKRHAQV